MTMKRLLLSLLVLCSLQVFALTDDQVIAFIRQQAAAGRTEQQIGKDLLAKGVTPEQAKRIKAKYEAQQSQERQSGNNSISGTSRMRNYSKRANVNDQNKNKTSSRSSQTSTSSRSPQTTTNSLEGVTIDLATSMEMTEGDDMVMGMESVETEKTYRDIYGHQVFNSETLTFAPNENIATPQNYRLGPGDEVIIDIWGNSEDHLRQTISPEGSIMIEQIGPVFLNGMTIEGANKHVKSAFSKKYAGMADAETDIQLTLGQVRSIQVDIMGEVATPGTFQMSPFSSVFHALYRAGGINDIGSLRNIQVLRNGRKVAGVDIYEYLFKGKSAGNIRLQEGDVIIVPPYDQLVNIEGNVKRPMYYEIKPGESVKSILDYAGGFTGDAYSEMVRLSRQDGAENELFNIEKGQFESYKLKDGDIITVGTILDRYSNRVELEGAVFRPGKYAINSSLNTVGELIRKADGLTEDAYAKRALLYREGPELQLEVVSLDLESILNGTSPDVQLKRNDVLVVSSTTEIMDRGSLTILGMIAVPGKYPYAENMTLEDLILEAGGLLNGASTARVDVSRRIDDPTSTTPTEQLSRSFTLSIENGLAQSKNNTGFRLKPYDVVIVRRSPGYVDQEFVTVRGEVLFSGQYAFEKRNERVSSFVARAGGLIDGAYVKGAQLTRRLTEAEYAARKETLRLAMANSANSSDSIALGSIEVADNYSVGIDLEMALAHPGSSYDIVLRAGDQLYVPEQQSTVKIAGDVMFPNTVVYVPGKKLSYYVDQAGGYGERARKGKCFVVYMNGSVAKGKKNTPIEPGCQIIVPSKPANSGTDWTKILAFATSFSSVATMAATITNIFK